MAEFNEHPTEDQLLVYIDGDSSGREEIESHIALCKECAEFVSAIGQAERYARIAPRLETLIAGGTKSRSCGGSLRRMSVTTWMACELGKLPYSQAVRPSALSLPRGKHRENRCTTTV